MASLIKLLIPVFTLFLSATSIADGGGGRGESEYSHLPSDFEKAVEAIEAEDYSMAIKQLEHLQISRSQDPDLLNLLGFSHRKLNDFILAEEYYLRALEIKPKHKGANEYLGKLYLQTDRLNKAQERLKVLKKASFFPNRQYRTLKKAIREYKNN